MPERAPGGRSNSTLLPRPVTEAPHDPGDLSQIVDMVEDCDDLLILGPEWMRTALEREYVAIVQQPERIVDVQTSQPLTEGQVVDRLRRLMS